jgi:hypothetical protein
MLLRKLFRLLVLGGSVLAGSTLGCAAVEQNEKADQNADARDGGADAGTATAASSDGGAAADAGGAGGVVGW